jgi:hypothetical protein
MHIQLNASKVFAGRETDSKAGKLEREQPLGTEAKR